MIDLNQYKNGKVTEEELEEFTDVFMRAKYDDDRRKRWQGMLDEDYKIKRNQPGRRFNKRVFIWGISTAAVIAIVIAMLMLKPANLVQNYEQLADTYLTEEFYENREDSRGDQDIEQINLKATFAYNQKDFTSAISYYETIINRGQANDTHHFFLGLSYLYTEGYDKAISNLLKVAELDANSKFIQEHRWFLALAYLKNKQINKGKAALLTILPGNWKYQEAQQLLEAIDR